LKRVTAVMRGGTSRRTAARAGVRVSTLATTAFTLARDREE